MLYKISAFKFSGLSSIEDESSRHIGAGDNEMSYPAFSKTLSTWEGHKAVDNLCEPSERSLYNFNGRNSNGIEFEKAPLSIDDNEAPHKLFAKRSEVTRKGSWRHNCNGGETYFGHVGSDGKRYTYWVGYAPFTTGLQCETASPEEVEKWVLQFSYNDVNLHDTTSWWTLMTHGDTWRAY